MRLDAGDMTDIDHFGLAETLRIAIGTFVRRTREKAGTPSDARSDTLNLIDGRGPMNAAMIAKRRAVTHQSARVVLKDLEAKGLIASEADPLDGRGRLYRLTSAGLDELKALRSARTRWIASRMSERLNDDECRTLADAVALLDRLSASSPD